MKERPILFNGDMVRAIQAGRKTQTRRVVKDPLDKKGGQFCVEYADNDPNMLVHVHDPKCGGYCDYACHYPCPYGQPGDRLWVRETWRPYSAWMGSRCGWEIEYRAGGKATFEGIPKSSPTKEGNWRPSMHMPRWASRITLEVTAVRVQRLQAISGSDIFAEGVENGYANPTMGIRYENAQRMAFEKFWDAINAKRGHSWAANPWVWAVSVKVVTP